MIISRLGLVIAMPNANGFYFMNMMRLNLRFARGRQSIPTDSLTLTPALALCLFVGGCASTLQQTKRWVVGNYAADYQAAERLSAETGSGMIFYYTDIALTRKDPMRDALKENLPRGDRGGPVACALFRENEPDRRYAAQFGVDRTPALIIVHPDGTYHARKGSQTREQIGEFLAESRPPGERPKLNPYIPREPFYTWNADLDLAERSAREKGRPLLVVLDRWMTRDWSRMKELLERREVYTRFADMVPCRPGSLWSSASAAATRFGVRDLPALVVVEPEGRTHVLELPTSYEAVVRFADSVRANSESAGEPPVTSEVSPVPIAAPIGK